MIWRYLALATLLMLTLIGCTPTTPPNTTTAPSTAPEPASVPPPSEQVPRITIDDLLHKIQSNEDIIIVDTRVDVETQFDIGHIKGAIPVPLSDITSGKWLPSADKEIILYCS